jgi:peptidoglycan biosynthesis protein MviN/MurJ (putative lipid II flippase)
MSELDPSARLDADESRPGVSRSLARSAGLIGATTLTSRVLGLVREQVMAYFFGASNAVDAFNVAFRIPNLVRDLFAEGAMSAAVVPTFTRTVAHEGRDAAWRLGHSVVTAVVIATAVFAALGMVFADPLVRLLAADYALVPGKIELTVLLTRTMMPFLMLVATAAVAMGMLNSLDRFFVPALAPAVFNVCSILTTLALLPILGRLGGPALVALLFERGHFTASDTTATAAALMCYAVGLSGYSIVKVATPTFYAIGQSRVPVIVSAATIAMNVALNLLLVRAVGYRGLALGTSIAALANASVLLYLLARRLDGLHVSHMASVTVRMFCAGAVMAIVAWGVEHELAARLAGHGLAIQLVRVGLAIVSGLATLTVAARLLRVEEFAEVTSAILSRVVRFSS